MIPNGSFENYSVCPTQFGQLTRAISWMNPSVGGQTNPGSPDFLNACDTANNAGVPYNNVGYQFAHSGNGYAGIALWSPVPGLENFREYLECPLDTVLQAGQCYHFEMYVNLANNMRYTTDAIGAYFSDTAIVNVDDNYVLPFSSQVNNTPGIIFDTLSWTLVSGNYIAHGGESFLLIGNFKDFANTQASEVNPVNTSNTAYVYVDDISLQACQTGINKISSGASVSVYPNPFDNLLHCSITSEFPVELTVYDLASRIVIRHIFLQSGYVNTEFLSPGLYTYRLTVNSRLLNAGKISKH